MEIPGSFQTVSEISIAFAGFSGLIISFRKKSGPLTYIEKYRLKVLLVLAFGAMFLAFLPEILHCIGAPAGKLWRLAKISIPLLAVLHLPMVHSSS